MRIGNVVELRANAALIAQHIRDLGCRAEIQRKTQVFAETGMVKARGKTGGKDHLFPKENVIGDTSTDKKVLISGDEKCCQRADVVAMHFPTIFDVDESCSMVSVDVENAGPDHQMRRGRQFFLFLLAKTA